MHKKMLFVLVVLCFSSISFAEEINLNTTPESTLSYDSKYINIVKSGRLNFNEGVTIAEILNNYNGFTEVSWFDLKNKYHEIYAECTVEKLSDKYLNTNFLPNMCEEFVRVEKYAIIFKFIVYETGSFKLVDVFGAMKLKNGEPFMFTFVDFLGMGQTRLSPQPPIFFIVKGIYDDIPIKQLSIGKYSSYIMQRVEDKYILDALYAESYSVLQNNNTANR